MTVHHMLAIQSRAAGATFLDIARVETLVNSVLIQEMSLLMFFIIACEFQMDCSSVHP
jgi:hypothetical protein